MAKPFQTLTARMSPEAQARAKRRTQSMLLELNLQELRQRCSRLTQEEVASLLQVTQPDVSKFERRGDMLLSTLYAFVRSLGGQLEIRVSFPGDQRVRVTQFDHLAGREGVSDRTPAGGTKARRR
jgi:predicted XRE-type DNA-binding protein